MTIPLITDVIYEQSSCGIVVSFFDTTQSPVIPSSVKWTLTDLEGNVVNERSEESITPGAVVTIVLSGADLAITSALVGRKRQLLVEAVYTGTLGTNLPLVQAVNFEITGLIGI
jgi:hypothetical protein